MRDIEIYPTRAELMEAAAERLVTLTERAIKARGLCTVVLSGGSTPRELYTLLSQEPFVSQLDWANLHVFWGDERAVPPAHPDSNYRLAADALLAKVPISPENVHRIPGELAPADAAIAYERVLRRFFGDAPATQHNALPGLSVPHALFDVVLLGMGADGHTASLFPGTTAVLERDRWVVPVAVRQLDAWRITLTPPVLNAARQILFLVAGAEKAWTLAQVVTGPYQPEVLPAQAIEPEAGTLLWLVDAAAAVYLDAGMSVS